MASTVIFSVPWDLHWPGGVNQVLKNLLEQSSRSDAILPVLFIPDYDIARATTSSSEGYETVRARVVSVWNDARPLRHLLALRRWPGNFLRLRSMLARLRPAAVNVHFPGLWCLTLLWALRCSCSEARFVLSFHGSDLKQLESCTGLTRWWWRTLLRSADAITCCSASLRERLVAAVGPDLPSVLVIHNGVDSGQLLKNLCDQPSPAAAAPRGYILNVATFEEKKGQDVLVRAFASLAVRYPDLKLVMVGRSGPALPALQQLIDQLGIADSALLVTDVPHEQVLPFFSGASVFVLSSRDEPFGIVLLEAACFDLPVVATEVGGVPEVVEDGVSGVLVPGDDATALAHAIQRLLDDPDFAARLAERARHRIEQEFTQTAAFHRYRAALLPREG